MLHNNHHRNEFSRRRCFNFSHRTTSATRKDHTNLPFAAATHAMGTFADWLEEDFLCWTIDRCRNIVAETVTHTYASERSKPSSGFIILRVSGQILLHASFLLMLCIWQEGEKPIPQVENAHGYYGIHSARSSENIDTGSKKANLILNHCKSCSLPLLRTSFSWLRLCRWRSPWALSWIVALGHHTEDNYNCRVEQPKLLVLLWIHIHSP